MKLDLTTLRVEMAKNNMNQKKLAELSKTRESTISDIMNKRSRGSISTWGKIAKALNISVKELIED